MACPGHAVALQPQRPGHRRRPTDARGAGAHESAPAAVPSTSASIEPGGRAAERCPARTLPLLRVGWLTCRCRTCRRCVAVERWLAPLLA